VNEELLRRGQRLDRYEIRELIGQGGMGQVYRAWDTVLRRDVAVKVLTVTEEEMLKRFAREAESIGRLDNHNVVEIHDLRFDADHHYIVMEYLRVESLNARLKRSALPVCEAVEVILGVCCGVAGCHRVGIIHRDLKPANVFLSETADYGVVVKVLDFGVAKPVQLSEEVTAPGKVAGTLRYLSPEQVGGGPADELSDQYQIGLLLYVCLTGTPPFADRGKGELGRAILSSDYPGLREQRPDVPSGLEQVIARAMHAEREKRYRSVVELARALVAYASAENQGLWAGVFEHSDAHSKLPVRLGREDLSGSVTKVDSPAGATETTQLVESAEVADLARRSVEHTETAWVGEGAVDSRRRGEQGGAPLVQEGARQQRDVAGTDTQSLVSGPNTGVVREGKPASGWGARKGLLGMALVAMVLGGLGALFMFRAGSGGGGDMPKWSSAQLEWRDAGRSGRGSGAGDAGADAGDTEQSGQA